MSSRRGETRAGAGVGGRAFTLVELLVVILIIAVIIAILLPSLAGARTAARRAATLNMMTSISNAAATFAGDERRQPGYFSERDMGSAENAGRCGMSSMENVMLDLIGMPPAGAPLTPGIKIGPTQATQIGFAFDMYGVSGGTKQYFNPDPKFYVAQTVGSQQVQTDPSSGHARAEGDPNQLKDVVDAWGMPVLAWRQDETATKPITTRADLVQDYSGNGPARFYWASNACFLRAAAAGRGGYSQTISAGDQNPGAGAKGSMIGSDAGGAPTVQQNGRSALDSLATVLGNPSAPGTYTPPSAPTFAAAARAPLVLQSAAQDGYFVGNFDRGRKQFAGVSRLDYQFNFVTRAGGTVPTDQYRDKDGNLTNADVMAGFDDLLAPTGN